MNPEGRAALDTCLQLRLIIDASQTDLRLLQLLAHQLGWSPRQVRRCQGEGRVRVNGCAILSGSPRLEVGTEVEVLDDRCQPALLPERLSLPILQQQAQLLFIDKPAGLTVCPGPGHPAGTLANGLRGLGCPLSSCEGPLRPGIVHRLDKGTSGIMVVAQDDQIHQQLVSLFQRHHIARTYLALVEGSPTWEACTLSGTLSRKHPGRKGYAVRPDGRRASSCFKVQVRYPGATLMLAQPETGRTHQIRVHLAFLGHPVLGDTLYGGGKPAARRAAAFGLRRPALHAARLSCPELGFDLCSPLPSDMTTAIAAMEQLRST